MRDIPGYEGLYAVTEDGKVWSYKFKKFLAPFDNGQGYLVVFLTKDKVRKHARVHRLVAMTYLPNPENKPEVDHIDPTKKYDNSVSNLRWVTSAENKANKTTNNVKRFTRIMCVDTGEVFRSQAAAARAKGIHRQGIANVLAGKQDSAGGFRWKRVV